MIIDTLENAARYDSLGAKFVKAFEYLQQTDFNAVAKGKYEIDGDNIFAIVNEYDSIEEAGEQMESHRKYIDVQYVAAGEERIGHDFLGDKTPSRAYSETEDYMLFAEKPAFYTILKQGQFAIFFPTDLHMPNLRVNGPVPVKKVVIKISVQ
ncbi:YhcH/YjgK/YiaL family protein [Chitinophaga sp. Hz27]|uniref:YhcH/YjgK/YiaL family protein n=1 Tax=Chitinophaga sp. Hz27 TaxID=3347169 RepID=UPI0035E1E751